ncbi:MAG: DUF1799 domain-containing protein [Ottowia sp.]|uniref:DUF1799 domain-containing protein n=1 Tax=Ottowia sp. TaxID=1898956 RepID=UPI003C786A01
MEAARRWANSRRKPQPQAAPDVPGSLAHLSARIGAGESEPDEYYIWPEHEQGWHLFMRFVSQARYAGMAGAFTGLDYTPILIWLGDQIDDRTRRDELFQQLQWCELGLLQSTAETNEMSQ